MRLKKIITIIFAALIMSCGSSGGGSGGNDAEGNTGEESVASMVYAGGIYTLDTSVPVAAVWINGTRQEFATTESYIYDMTVYEGEIYACGSYYKADSPVAVMWIGAAMTELSDLESEAISITVDSDGTIYVAGTLKASNTSTVWKIDSTGTTLLFSESDSIINSIALSDSGAVYMGGAYEESSGNRAAVWKNNIRTSLSSDDSIVTSITLDNGSVYAAGYTTSASAVWKDEELLYDIRSNISGHSLEITSIAIHDAVVYVAGKYLAETFYYVGALWVNGVKQMEISDDEHVTINDIALYETSVYTAGTTGNKGAAIWLNGKKLQVDGAEKADITCLYVE